MHLIISFLGIYLPHCYSAVYDTFEVLFDGVHTKSPIASIIRWVQKGEVEDTRVEEQVWRSAFWV